jgi:uncharacterized protein YceH (UPF0502 family)
VEPDAVELRVVGCLVEKQRTTPDAYPLTLNSLRLACNQSTNREPVVEYDESTIRRALDRLVQRKWATLASWSNRRAMKYRHTLDTALGLDDAETALLCVLMLRGPQTPGELKQRTERLHRFASADELEQTLERLAERELAARLPRRPGQREERYEQLLGGREDGEPAISRATEPSSAPAPGTARPQVVAPSPPPVVADAAPPPARPGSPDGLERRIARLEEELASLRRDFQALRNELGG